MKKLTQKAKNELAAVDTNGYKTEALEMYKKGYSVSFVTAFLMGMSKISEAAARHAAEKMITSYLVEVKKGGGLQVCTECRQSPCSSGCPNCEPEKSIYICANCSEAIYEGDKYMEIDNRHFHKECIYDLDIVTVLRQCFDMEVKTAGDE